MFVHPTTLNALLSLHFIVLAALTGAVALRRHEAWLRGLLRGSIWCVTLGYLALMAYAGYELASSRDVLIASAGVIAYLTFAICLYPGRHWSLLALVACAAAFSFPAAAAVEGGLIWAGILSVVLVNLAVCRRAFERAIEWQGRQEYRFRRLIAPAHVVRRSLDNSELIRDAFKPELKFCVCIASDWRDYQAISANLTPSQLTMTLNEYYTLCETLLSRCLPLGNYYTDWIADELFVVIYAEGDMTEGRLIDAAVSFSEDLIRAKVEFSRVHSLPRAIDVGISAGSALLGLMGPDAHKKATALGEVPGRSRRFQGAGKLLRLKLGQKDRIIFGRDCLMRLKQPHDVQELPLAPSDSVRDVADREIFFIEPELSPRSPRQEAA